MLAKSLFSSGMGASYGKAISTNRAHFPLISIFQRIRARLDMGLPTHRLIALLVLQNALLSKGAWSRVPTIGRTQVVIVAAVVDQGYH